jgi:hypothetical protein
MPPKKPNKYIPQPSWHKIDLQRELARRQAQEQQREIHRKQQKAERELHRKQQEAEREARRQTRAEQKQLQPQPQILPIHGQRQRELARQRAQEQSQSQEQKQPQQFLIPVPQSIPQTVNRTIKTINYPTPQIAHITQRPSQNINVNLPQTLTIPPEFLTDEFQNINVNLPQTLTIPTEFSTNEFQFNPRIIPPRQKMKSGIVKKTYKN